MICAKINGGFNGFEDRLKKIKNAFKEMNISNSTEYNFVDSEIYDYWVYSFAWGLWHDSGSNKFQSASMKNNEEAKKAYLRTLNLIENKIFPQKNIKNKNIKYYGHENPKIYIKERLKAL